MNIKINKVNQLDDFMGMLLDALEGRRKSIAFGDLVNAVRENPKDIESWTSLVDRLRHQAATGSENHRYAEGWHQEAWDACKKALELNPNDWKLRGYIEVYKQFLITFGYSVQ